MPESAFIVRVPEAEPVVGRLREQFDPSARLGVPAHITVLFPFKSPELLTAEDLRTFIAIIALIPRFTFALAEVRRFPETIYLAPEPAGPFMALTRAIQHAFPDYPPYAGQDRDVVPHLTVARTNEPQQSLLHADLSARLPKPRGIVAVCTELALIENSSGRWESMHAFALGATAHTAG